MCISKHQNRIESILKGAGEKLKRVMRGSGENARECACVCEGRGCILNGYTYTNINAGFEFHRYPEVANSPQYKKDSVRLSCRKHTR